MKIKSGEEKYHCLASISAFSKRYLGMHLPEHQIAWSKVCEQVGNKVIFAPAAHGKTSLFSVIRVIWKIVRNRAARRIIASATEELSSSILSTISYQLLNNHLLISDFGPFYSSECEWSSDSIRVLQADYNFPPSVWKPSGRKDPTIRSVGVGTNCLGLRCDELIADDILNIKNSRTDEMRKTMRSWWWNELEPTVDSGGKIIWVGNPVHRYDLSQELCHDPEYKSYVFKAIYDDNTKQVLWPEKWPYEKLALRRKRDPVSFARRFQSVPVSDSDYVDWEKLQKCFNGSKVLREFLDWKDIKDYKKIVLSIDPAFTVRKKSSYSAILTVGLTLNDEIEIIGVWKEKVLFDSLKRMIQNKINVFRPSQVLIESNAQQYALVQEIQKLPNVPSVIPIFTGGNSTDLDDRFSLLTRLIDMRYVILPYGDDKSRRMVDDLCNEIAEYPSGEHDDLYMALSQACKHLVYVSDSKLNNEVSQKIWKPQVRFSILGRNISSKFNRSLSKFATPLRS